MKHRQVTEFGRIGGGGRWDGKEGGAVVNTGLEVRLTRLEAESRRRHDPHPKPVHRWAQFSGQTTDDDDPAENG